MNSTSALTLRDGVTVAVRRLATSDVIRLSAFLRAMPERDLLFFGQDISRDEVLHGWAAEGGDTVATVAERDGDIVAFAYVQRNRPAWLQHVGDVVAIVGPALRGRGLGTVLLREALVQARRLQIEKVAARIVIEDRDSIRAFEKLGFRHEGVLIDHAKAADGTRYDLAAMGLDLATGSERLVRADAATLDLTRR